MDEVADVTFAYAFNIIMEIFSNMMIEEFDLNEEKISSMIDKFVSALTPSMQRHLQAARLVLNCQFLLNFQSSIAVLQLRSFSFLIIHGTCFS